MYEKINQLIDVLFFFCSNEFTWESSRMMKIYNQLDDVDKKVKRTSFFFIVVDNYFTVFVFPRPRLI